MFDVKPITSKISVDCGATCLQMLLAYYGIDADLHTLINDCETKVIGCTAGGIKRAAEKHGMPLKAYKIDAEELLLQDRPSIIHWKSNHFCVFCGLDENGKAVICNPDRGRYGIPINSFKAFYSGVALFNGEPCGIPSPKTEKERIAELEARNEMLEECLIELANIIYA